MKKNPEELLSVVVPVYNVAPYLDRCISSITNQTYRNLEIILVDDGSTDESGKICDTWKQQDSRIVVLHQPNGGAVMARKRGTEVSTGAYITQVDGDDWIEKEMYERLMYPACINGADVVTSGTIKDYGSHLVLDEGTIAPGLYEGERLRRLLDHIISAEKFYQAGISAHIVDKIYRREIYLRFQMCVDPLIRYSEDPAVVFPLLFHAKRIVVSGEHFYHYCVRDNSVCGTVVDDPIGAKALEEHLNRQMEDLGELRQSAQKQMRIFQAYSRSFTCPDTFFRVCDGNLYPYADVNVHQRILIYGGGKFGQRLRSFLEKHPEFQIAAWTDKVKKAGYVPVEQALSMEYDVILIAVALAAPADDICQELIEKGIDENKIRRIDMNKILEMT